MKLDWSGAVTREENNRNPKRDLDVLDLFSRSKAAQSYGVQWVDMVTNERLTRGDKR